jgi:hypothetical protein
MALLHPLDTKLSFCPNTRFGVALVIGEPYSNTRLLPASAM